MTKYGSVRWRVGHALRPIPLVAMALFVCAGCLAAKSVGGPYFYKRWNSYITPAIPVDPVPETVARTLTEYCEAYFDSEGRIVRFLTHSKARGESETTYTYRVGGGFVQRDCWEGKVEVTEYDKKGKVTASRRSEGECSATLPTRDGGRDGK